MKKRLRVHRHRTALAPRCTFAGCAAPAVREGHCPAHWPHQAFIVASVSASVQAQQQMPDDPEPLFERLRAEMFTRLTGYDVGAYLAAITK